MANTSNNKTTDDMSFEEISRWLCLFEAVNYVSHKAEKLGIDIDKNDSWIKPLAFKNYITEMYQSTLMNLKIEDKIKPNQVQEYVYTEDALHS